MNNDELLYLAVLRLDVLTEALIESNILQEELFIEKWNAVMDRLESEVEDLP